MTLKDIGDATDISDRSSFSPSTHGGAMVSTGIRSVTETCLDKQPIDANTSDVAANNIVAFSATPLLPIWEIGVRLALLPK